MRKSSCLYRWIFCELIVMAMLFRSIAGFSMAPTRMAVFRGYANKFALRTSQTLSNVNLKSNLKAFSIYNLSENELKSLLLEWKQPSFRAKQIFSWLYEKGARDFDAMLDLPLPLREKLKASFQFGTLKLISEQVSKDGTRKRAYELLDGQIIESVLMPYKDGRRTACISSQAGCGMGCVFCATGQMGFSRQLTSGEIFEQAQLFSSELKAKGERLSNIVMMGMGEPLANYDNVLTAIRRFNDELGIGARHITISTVGIAPRIRKLAEENLQVGLAISLHQATDEKRSALMPVNKRFNIETLIDACRYYIEKTNRRISFEWALISGQTDTDDSAHELGVLLRGLLCHVNVIPLNPTKGFDGQPTTKVSFINIYFLLQIGSSYLVYDV